MTPLWMLAGCGWNHLPAGNDVWLEDLWEPSQVVAAEDGLYVRLLRSGGLARVSPRGDDPVALVDVGEGVVTRVDPTPDGDGVIALIERYGCDTDDDLPRRPTVDDCPEDDLLRSTELSVVRGAKAGRSTRLDGTYNAVQVSDDGAFAIAWLDLATLDGVDDVVNLTGVAVLDVGSGGSVLVPVGFAPERVLFAADPAGATDRAVVLSRNQVALLELADGPPRRSVTFPLALDADEGIDPRDVALTPDGGKALVTAAGRSDLYVLDLVSPSINIVELAGQPTDLQVVAEADLSALVFADQAVLQLVDHATFGTTTIQLDEPMDRIVVDEGRLILYGAGRQHDVYRYDVATRELTEYTLQNPATGLSISPDHGFAVVLTAAESGDGDGVDGFYDRYPGMEILDLLTDDATPFLLEGDGLGLAFDDDGQVLLLQEDQDYLYRYDLLARTESTVRLSTPPRAVGSLPDGTSWVAQDARLGLVTFLTPPRAREVGGFAVLGIADPVSLLGSEAP
jgi:hypothetical protein